MAVKAVDVSMDMDASIDDVFERLSDHGAYGAFPGIMAARLAQAGETDKNGVGAIREVTLGAFGFLPIEFIEEIPLFERPRVFEYKVQSAHYNLGLFRVDTGIIHHGGRLTFKETNGRTTVRWVSRFEMTWPLLKYITAAALEIEGTRLFMNVLKHIKRESEESSPKK
jgi:hypothetical protein